MILEIPNMIWWITRWHMSKNVFMSHMNSSKDSGMYRKERIVSKNKRGKKDYLPLSIHQRKKSQQCETTAAALKPNSWTEAGHFPFPELPGVKSSSQMCGFSWATMFKHKVIYRCSWHQKPKGQRESLKPPLLRQLLSAVARRSSVPVVVKEADKVREEAFWA